MSIFAMRVELVIASGHVPHKETALMLRTDDPEFFDCCFQRGCLIGCFDDPDERTG